MRVLFRKVFRFMIERASVPALIAALVMFFVPNVVEKALLKEAMLSALLTVATILAGFFSTGMTILLSLDGKRAMDLLAKLKLVKRFNQQLWVAVKWQLWMAAVCIVSLALQETTSMRLKHWLATALTFTIVGSAVSSYYGVRNIWSLLERHFSELEARADSRKSSL
jgi:hypothetical protein